MNLKTFYNTQLQRIGIEIGLLKKKSRFYVAGEIMAFMLFLGLLVLYTLVHWGAIVLLLALLSFVSYIFIRHFDVINDQYIHDLDALHKVYQNELLYLDGDFSCFDDGQQYINPNHPFTFDLDIFGRDSLFQRINRTVTTGGSDFLAAQLSKTEDQSSRGDAINELAQHESWCADFVALGQDRKIDSSEILRALNEIHQIEIPHFAAKRWTFFVAWLFILGLFASIVASIAGLVSANVPIWWIILQFFGVFFVCSGACRIISKVVDRLHLQMKNYVKLIRLISKMPFQVVKNRILVSKLEGSLEAFEQLNDILNGLDRRGNILGLLLMDSLFLSDFFLIRCFLRWQHQYIDLIPTWVKAVNELDAIVSMAIFRFNEPEAGRADVVSSDEIIYQANGLYHPFLGKKAIKNDFILNDGNYYIITGANMAGKSTFLRALGINYLLAMNGMPVFAEHLKVSPFQLFSSMRTTDDLAHGISYFNAEILRLKKLIAYCQHNRRTLIILDEILKGTNSLDKLNGSKLFLQWISNLPVTGVIATHDLELSKMESPRFHNYCFEIELGQHVTYSYKISPGVARNQNATFLLNEILHSDTWKEYL
ncbi:MAG: DNA mismatch repair protein MutS [Prevotella sp.]